MLRVEGELVRQAAGEVVRQTPEERTRLRLSVTKAIDRAAPKVLKGRASKQECDDLMADLCLLYALNAFRS